MDLRARDFFGGCFVVRLASVVGNLAGISGAVIVAVVDFCFLEGVAFFGGFRILFGASGVRPV